jgi:3-oxoacyl-[acyl-carrier protein] reductase
VSSDRLEGTALVTGGGRGIGRSVARELADAGMRVAVSARTAEQVEEAAREIDGLAVTADVSDPAQVRDMVAHVERELGPLDLLVNNAGIASWGGFFDDDAEAWWHLIEINVRGPYLCCRAVVPGMLERGGGRIVNMGSGASYLPSGGGNTAYGASKAALGRFSELLARELSPKGVFVFLMSPGMVRTEMTDHFGDNLPWTPPELAPRLVRVLASGRADALAGRYIHAEHDDIEDLIARADEISEGDLNAIRLQR